MQLHSTIAKHVLTSTCKHPQRSSIRCQNHDKNPKSPSHQHNHSLHSTLYRRQNEPHKKIHAGNLCVTMRTRSSNWTHAKLSKKTRVASETHHEQAPGQKEYSHALKTAENENAAAHPQNRKHRASQGFSNKIHHLVTTEYPFPPPETTLRTLNSQNYRRDLLRAANSPLRTLRSFQNNTGSLQNSSEPFQHFQKITRRPVPPRVPRLKDARPPPPPRRFSPPILHRIGKDWIQWKALFGVDALTLPKRRNVPVPARKSEP